MLDYLKKILQANLNVDKNRLASELDSIGGGTEGAVKYNEVQTLTDEEKEIARNNIDVPAGEDVFPYIQYVESQSLKKASGPQEMDVYAQNGVRESLGLAFDEPRQFYGDWITEESFVKDSNNEWVYQTPIAPPIEDMPQNGTLTFYFRMSGAAPIRTKYTIVDGNIETEEFDFNTIIIPGDWIYKNNELRCKNSDYIPVSEGWYLEIHYAEKIQNKIKEDYIDELNSYTKKDELDLYVKKNELENIQNDILFNNKKINMLIDLSGNGYTTDIINSAGTISAANSDYFSINQIGGTDSTAVEANSIIFKHNHESDPLFTLIPPEKLVFLDHYAITYDGLYIGTDRFEHEYVYWKHHYGELLTPVEGEDLEKIREYMYKRTPYMNNDFIVENENGEAIPFSIKKYIRKTT